MLRISDMADYPPYSWDDFLRRIREVREDKGLSQEACAAALGLKDKTQYTKRENGSTQFELELIDRLRDFFGMPRPWPFVPSSDAFLLQQRLRDQEEGRTPTASAMLASYLQRHQDLEPRVIEEMRRIAERDRADWGEEELSDIELRANRFVTMQDIATIRLLSAVIDDPDLFADALKGAPPDLAQTVKLMASATERAKAAGYGDKLVAARLELARKDPERFGRYAEDPVPELPPFRAMIEKTKDAKGIRTQKSAAKPHKTEESTSQPPSRRSSSRTKRRDS